MAAPYAVVRRKGLAVIVLLQVLAVLAVVFGVAVVLTGRAEGMSEEGQDLADTGIPRDRPMTPQDVVGLRFALAFRGYRMSEVDDALDRLAAELSARDELIERLRRGGATDEDDESRWWATPEEPEHVPTGEPDEPEPAFASPGDDLGPAAGAGAAGGLGAGEAVAMPSTPVAEPAAATAAGTDVTAAVEEYDDEDEDEPAGAFGAPEPAFAAPEPFEAPEPMAAPEPFEVREPAAEPAGAWPPEPAETPADPLPAVPTPPADDAPPAADEAPAAAADDDPLFGALPTTNPFRPEVPEIPTYDPWAVTPRSRYTDGPEYVEVDHPEEDDAPDVATEHQTGYAPPPPAAEDGADGAEDEDDDGPPPLRPWQS